MRWVVVTDEHGTDIAVHGAPGDVLVFPTSVIGKRIAGGESCFSSTSTIEWPPISRESVVRCTRTSPAADFWVRLDSIGRERGTGAILCVTPSRATLHR